MISLPPIFPCPSRPWRRVAAACAVLVLGGCATVANVESNIKRTEDATTSLRESLVKNAASGAIIRTKRPRLAGEEIVVKSSTLPATFNQKISYVTKGGQTLAEALEDISASSGVPIRATEIAAAAASSGGLGGMPGPGLSGDPISGAITLEYAGTLRGLLDEVAGKGDCSWRYNTQKRQVEFYRYETRTFSVAVPAGAKDVASSISLAGVTGGSGGGGGSAGAGNVSISHSLKIDPWSSLMEGVRSILSDGRVASGAGAAPTGVGAGRGAAPASGGNGAIANPELGLVTVTAKPMLLDRVGRYIASINSRFARNILMDVRIFSVTLNDQASAGMNVNLLYDRINKVAGAIAGPASLAAGTTTPGLFTIASAKPGSKWDNSSLVLEALSQYGKVALVKQTNLLAVNGQPAPLQVANEISYVSGSQTTLTTGAGAQISQTTSQKVVGFTAFFTPLILGDNRILLSYQLQISALAQPLTANASGVQTPNINSQSLPGQAFVRDGDAIVLFGFDEQRDGTDAALHPAGASKAVTRERQMMVVVVQVNTGERAQ